jgi:Zn-dependent oligopeptidase
MLVASGEQDSATLLSRPIVVADGSPRRDSSGVVAPARPNRIRSAAERQRRLSNQKLEEAKMTIMFVRHHVADYEAWRRVYDSVGEIQRQGGVTEEAVYRAEDDPDDVLVMHQFSSSGEAHSFMENPDLRKAMADAGVDAGSLRVEVYERA